VITVERKPNASQATLPVREHFAVRIVAINGSQNIGSVRTIPYTEAGHRTMAKDGMQQEKKHSAETDIRAKTVVQLNISMSIIYNQCGVLITRPMHII
jgi:hypothetical protein